MANKINVRSGSTSLVIHVLMICCNILGSQYFIAPCSIAKRAWSTPQNLYIFSRIVNPLESDCERSFIAFRPLDIVQKFGPSRTDDICNVELQDRVGPTTNFPNRGDSSGHYGVINSEVRMPMNSLMQLFREWWLDNDNALCSSSGKFFHVQPLSSL